MQRPRPLGEVLITGVGTKDGRRCLLAPVTTQTKHSFVPQPEIFVGLYVYESIKVPMNVFCCVHSWVTHKYK